MIKDIENNFLTKCPPLGLKLWGSENADRDVDGNPYALLRVNTRERGYIAWQDQAFCQIFHLISRYYTFSI